MNASIEESRIGPAWRRPAPRARALAKILYSWRSPGKVLAVAVAAAAPFPIAAALAPGLLSLSPTLELIGPIAEARSLVSGGAGFRDLNAPFYSLLLLAADAFGDTPGRVHLIAKAIAAALAASPAAYFAAARFPATMAVAFAAAIAAYTAAPYSGPPEFALSLFLALALAVAAAPADESRARARAEGVLVGLILAALWLLSPACALAGFIGLSVCPFLTGRAGLSRYLAALVVVAAAGGLAEIASPGVALARAQAASALLEAGVPATGVGAAALAGLAASTGVVLFAAAVFGGGAHARSWLAGAGLLAIGLLAARLAGANPAPVFIAAAAFAAVSVASPFYDGVFRDHDRASVALGVVAASLTLFWTLSLVAHSTVQFVLQAQVAAAAPEDIRRELALVQPGGPTIATWIEEGRFSTPEARELFALAPVDQSAMLLEAAAAARRFSAQGVDVAILAGADAACVIAGAPRCAADGVKAAERAKVVFAPRLNLDPATAAETSRAEALLFTEFRLAGQTPLWDIWVRRGATLPVDLAFASGDGR